MIAEIGSKLIELFTAALSPIIAIAVTLIAYRQFKIENDKLKLDLYEKRFKVYQAIIELLSIIFSKDDISLEEIVQFSIKTNESRFLFEREIPDHIETIRIKAIGLRQLEYKIKQKTNFETSEMQKKVEESNNLKDWFHDQFKTTNNLFEKYLSFKKIW